MGLPDTIKINDAGLVAKIVRGTEFDGYARRAEIVRSRTKAATSTLEFYSGDGFLGVAYYARHKAEGVPPTANNFQHRHASQQPGAYYLLVPSRTDLPRIAISKSERGIKIGVLKWQ